MEELNTVELNMEELNSVELNTEELNTVELNTVELNMERLISHVKQKDLCYTSYGVHMYSTHWYCCNKNKICITFTPRGGCSISFQQFLDINDLLHDGLEYNLFIHYYRGEIIDKIILHRDINQLIEEKYTFIKFIMNPYIRAVSIYRAQTSHNLSFREYLKHLVNNTIEFLNDNDKFHLCPQYIDGEENIITKYIKIDKNETYNVTLFDGTLYMLDVNKYTSIHHGQKNVNNTTFSGDIPLNIINGNLPKTYKYFYDDEIKTLVETYYKTDIEHYAYSFDEF